MDGYLKIIKELKSKRNIDNNLDRYFKIILGNYYKMSATRLTMNYFTFYESVSEYSYLDIPKVNDILNETNLIVSNVFGKGGRGTSNEPKNEDIEKIKRLRAELTGRIDELVTLGKAFTIVEYAINRVEHRFDGKTAKIDDNIVLQSMMQYIFSDKENVVISDKIKLIIGQLPIRMAKTKLYNMIGNTFTLYNGSDKASLDSFVETLEIAAMLSVKEDGQFSDYNKILNDLLSIDYKNIDKITFENASSKLNEAMSFINNATDCYVSLMEIINDIYEIMLTQNYSDDFSQYDSCAVILEKVAGCIYKGEFLETFDECMKHFVGLEGVQEELMPQQNDLEGLLVSINEGLLDDVNRLELDYSLDIANKCCILNSTSMFADLDNVSVVSETQRKADDNYVNEVREKFLNDFAAKLANYSGLIKRAIMASVLSELPVRFKTSNEVSEYISSSLSSCKDEAEKAAFIEIVDQLMS